MARRLTKTILSLGILAVMQGCSHDVAGKYTITQKQSGPGISDKCATSSATLTLTEDDSNRVRGSASNDCISETLSGIGSTRGDPGNGDTPGVEISGTLLTLTIQGRTTASGNLAPNCTYVGSLSVHSDRLSGTLSQREGTNTDTSTNTSTDTNTTTDESLACPDKITLDGPRTE